MVVANIIQNGVNKQFQKVYSLLIDSSGNEIISDLALIIDDYTTTDVTYFCYAEPGSLTSAAVWKIKIIDETGNYPIIKWADGNSNFDNVADNRASLVYS